MQVGNYNLFQIRLNLQLFHNKEEKLRFLYEIKKDIRRIVLCFTEKKALNLRHYVRDEMYIHDNCNELKEFLKRAIAKNTGNLKDSRFPGEDVLHRELKLEAAKYLRLEDLVEEEIDNVLKEYHRNQQSTA